MKSRSYVSHRVSLMKNFIRFQRAAGLVWVVLLVVLVPLTVQGFGLPENCQNLETFWYVCGHGSCPSNLVVCSYPLDTGPYCTSGGASADTHSGVTSDSRDGFNGLGGGTCGWCGGGDGGGGSGAGSTGCCAPPPPGTGFWRRDARARAETWRDGISQRGQAGMPRWWVEEPTHILYVVDKPIFYFTSTGREMAFELQYKSKRGSNGDLDATQYRIFSVGKNWSTPWRSYIQQSDITDGDGKPAFWVVMGDGSVRLFPQNQPEQFSRAVLTFNSDEGSYVLTFPSGSQNVYGIPVVLGGQQYVFLSSKSDGNGNTTSLSYNFGISGGITNWIRLSSIVDEDNLGFTFEWSSSGPYSNVLTFIRGPFATNELGYGGANLSYVVDAVGLGSELGYSGSGKLESCATPYGSIYFTEFATNSATALLVDELGLRKHLYLAGHDRANVLPTAVPEAMALNSFIGSSSTLETNSFDTRNTFYWGPRQYQNLPSSFRSVLSTNGPFDPASLTTNDLKLAWTRHWLRGRTGTNDTNVIISSALSMERAPSPDTNGVTEGLLTWYDYDGKTAPFGRDYIGTSRQPKMVAARVPGGEWQVTRTMRNSLGHPERVEQTYSVRVADEVNNEVFHWTNAWRTNIYLYAENGMDVLSERFAAGAEIHLVSSNVFNTSHQVTTNYNALGEVTYFEFNVRQQVTKMTNSAGLIVDYSYSGGFLSSVVERSAATNFRTNQYTWESGGFLRTHTDPRGAVTTNTWDGLGRLVQTANEAGTVTHTYENLDRVRTIDRMGFTNDFAYNGFGQMTLHTDANAHVTTNQYCDCGALDAVIDALGNTTSYAYDNLGRLVRTTYADGSWTENTYDLLNRVVRTADSSGSSTTNHYVLNGLLYRRESALGTVWRAFYDAEDRMTNSLNGDGVLTLREFDLLGRVVYSDTIDYEYDPWDSFFWDFYTESFGYSPRGLIAHTNSLGKVTRYAYDELGRKTAETNANAEVTQFSYSPAGDLLTLTDGKSQTTTWKYDLLGRVTNKLDAASTVIFRYGYDANGRLTNRWTPAKGTTVYSYDAAGNLTFVNYPSSPDLTFQYDALHRLTNMLDGVGTTVYSYANFGAVLSEDGPWEKDTVSFTYTNRLRAGLSLAQFSGPAWTQGYGYDASHRVKSISSPAGTFTYGFSLATNLADRYPDTTDPLSLAGTLIGGIGLPNGSTNARSYDVLGRLTGTYLKNSGNTVLNQHEYAYDAAHRPTNQVRLNGDFVGYTYDESGQLKTAVGKESGGTTNRVHERFGYAYDAAGNLNHRTNNAFVQTFSVDSLNQLSNATRSGNLTVAGYTTADATNVTVNANSSGAVAALRYADRTFARTNVSFLDGNNTFAATAQDAIGRTDTTSETVNLPATVNFVYDSNGNMLTDGRRHFMWDDENQLIAVVVTNVTKSEFGYDGKMRRRVRKEYVWQNGAWQQTEEVRYVYDANLVIQERFFAPQLSTLIPQRSVTYTRGLDLSGSFQGAGGIGGLLARTEFAIGAVQSAFYHADSVGNVTTLVDTNQQLVARYLYEPFGRVVAMSGPLAEGNLYRFSSKEAHDQSGLVYYLYRFYEPGLQRWPKHDPLGEIGFETMRRHSPTITGDGPNLFLFVRNAPPLRVDANGDAGTILIGAGVGSAVCPGIGTVIGTIVGTIVTVGGIVIIAINPHAKPTGEKCDKIGEEDSPGYDLEGDGFLYGSSKPPTKICRYRCPKTGVIKIEFPAGTKCPEPFILKGT